MRIFTTCLDGELLWAIDDTIGGLYSINQRTFETKCVIDYRKLYPHGRFIVQSLMKWKEDYIVMIPLEVDKSWILYNKVTEKIEYRKITERKCRGTLITADQNRNQMYFFPRYIKDPILIVDPDTLICSKVIENWSGNAPKDCGETAWKGAYDGQYVFFPIKNTKILVRIDCETQSVELLELNVSENVIDVDFVAGELWVLPMSGNQLYQVDENGRIVNTVELTVENTEDFLPDFSRIVAQKRYLFLLPFYRKGIYVYDKLERNTCIIPEESTISEKKKEIDLRYWGYYVWDNRIYFLPFRDKCLEINLDTLVYKERQLDYPAIWSEEEKIEGIIWSHVYEGDSVIRETDGCNLAVFLKYIRYKANKGEISSVGHEERRIWDMLKDRKKPT